MRAETAPPKTCPKTWMQDLGSPAAGADRTFEELLTAVGRDRDRAAFAALFGHFAPRLKA